MSGQERLRVKVEFESHVNFSLVSNHLQPIIRVVSIPPGTSAIAYVEGFSGRSVLHLADGETRNISPPLDHMAFAALSQPRASQLVIRCSNGEQVFGNLTVLPLRAWDQRRAFASATAAFVLENDPYVLSVIRKADFLHAPPGNQSDRCKRLYEGIARSLRACYLLDPGVLTDCNGEQFIRFPSQISWNMGGTCIDWCLLLAGVFAAAGMNPMVMLLGEEDGARHALTGVLPAGRTVPSAVVSAQDIGALLSTPQFLAIEPTALSIDAGFEEAAAQGLRRAREQPLLWAISIEAARLGQPRISSLPESTRIVHEGRPTATQHAFTTTRMTGAADALSQFRLEGSPSHSRLAATQSWPLRGYAASIGRYPDNTVHLADISVSREHALLFALDGGVYLKDLGSLQGTWLDGVPIEPFSPVPVPENARLRFGAVELRLRRVTTGVPVSSRQAGR